MSASMSIDHPLYPPVDGVKRAQVSSTTPGAIVYNIMQ